VPSHSAGDRHTAQQLRQHAAVCGSAAPAVPPRSRTWSETASAEEDFVYVRTWHRRSTGWFGHVLEARRARIRVPGPEADVAVEDVSEGSAQLRADVDAAYHTKYGRYGSSSVDAMVAEAAAAATLHLSRV
jgi:hypothetical protein